ncbi:protein phosphatase family protein [Akanthomyces lecanii RCEF 1005]|uniref:Protein phosphatase family protein n=1 Tax=Akanthomyces lecanii RCEF 1005 TaxID=1081108 RepID=A0A168H1W4_CORDF|nr:protein phosphatase family protein [Akanthomyces lecanii RCEF 1005]
MSAAESAEPKSKVFPISKFLDDPTPQLPSPSSSGSSGAAKRLIFVGDVHGMKEPLERLLEKVKFDRASGDHLVLVGDVVNKGTDNSGVVELGMELGALAVRGNHDNAVLDAAGMARFRDGTWLSELTTPGEPLDSASVHKPNPHSETTINTAAALSAVQLQWLASLPLILRITLSQHHSSPLANIIVVHAGLVPGVPLDRQDPHEVMHLRSLVAENGIFRASEDAGEDGWAADWERAQEDLEESQRRTVIFGHDARRGLQVRKYSVGLDTGCVYGNQLSALVLTITEGGIMHRVVQVEAVEPG